MSGSSGSTCLAAFLLRACLCVCVETAGRLVWIIQNCISFSTNARSLARSAKRQELKAETLNSPRSFLQRRSWSRRSPQRPCPGRRRSLPGPWHTNGKADTSWAEQHTFLFHSIQRKKKTKKNNDRQLTRWADRCRAWFWAGESTSSTWQTSPTRRPLCRPGRRDFRPWKSPGPPASPGCWAACNTRNKSPKKIRKKCKRTTEFIYLLYIYIFFFSLLYSFTSNSHPIQKIRHFHHFLPDCRLILLLEFVLW